MFAVLLSTAAQAGAEDCAPYGSYCIDSSGNHYRDCCDGLVCNKYGGCNYPNEFLAKLWGGSETCLAEGADCPWEDQKTPPIQGSCCSGLTCQSMAFRGQPLGVFQCQKPQEPVNDCATKLGENCNFRGCCAGTGLVCTGDEPSCQPDKYVLWGTEDTCRAEGADCPHDEHKAPAIQGSCCAGMTCQNMAFRGQPLGVWQCQKPEDPDANCASKLNEPCSFRGCCADSGLTCTGDGPEGPTCQADQKKALAQ